MTWEVILTSGITAAIVSAFVSVIGSYIVGKRLQEREHKYQEEVKKEEDEANHQALLRSRRINDLQKQVLEFCRSHPSKQYILQGHSGMYFLRSCDTKETMKSGYIAIKDQIQDMVYKRYFSEISDNDFGFMFAMTDQGKHIPIGEVHGDE